jgi:hypothetical protein
MRLFVLVEQLFEEGFLPLIGLLVVAGMRLLWRRLELSLPALRLFFPGSLEDFVEFPAIEPYSPAFGAIVDLDSFALRQNEVGFFAVWAFHKQLLATKIVKRLNRLN